MPALDLRPLRGLFPSLLIIAITHVPAGPFEMNIFNDPGRSVRLIAILDWMSGRVMVMG